MTLHGTDLAHPRSRVITLAGLRAMDLVCASPSRSPTTIPRWAAQPVVIPPVGVDTHRFKPIPRAEARAALGLDPDQPCVLFPADPNRPEKRFDRAQQLAADAKLLTLGDVEPDRVPFYVNAANAVLVPSEREGFGLATLEALACNVPVLSTPTGIAPEALKDIKARSARRSIARSGAKRCARRWETKIRVSKADKEPRSTRPTRWPPSSWTPGERCYDARIGQREANRSRAAIDSRVTGTVWRIPRPANASSVAATDRASGPQRVAALQHRPERHLELVGAQVADRGRPSTQSRRQ